MPSHSGVERGLKHLLLATAIHPSHASALIAAGLDVVTVSRRLGHGSPGITLQIYAHRFADTDKVAATAMDAALRR